MSKDPKNMVEYVSKHGESESAAKKILECILAKIVFLGYAHRVTHQPLTENI